ncbi:MAG TPA: peptidase S10, partial [Hyphomonas atlantica]|nr:peptidase S10 [Hyphomonas atlantica]
MRTLLLAACMAVFALPGLADDTANGKTDPADIPDAQVFTSDHSLRLGSKTVKYRTVASETYLRNEKDEPTASVFSVAYVDTSTTSAAQRPVTFVFNGGPGSASLWLHMGAFGPKQVLTPSDASDVGAPPYTMRDNPNSLLDVTDLVFIDPVGTGYSRPLGETEGKEFYGVNEDAESIAEFIRIWLTENGRWNSP